MDIVDLGPTDDISEGLGPNSAEEAQAFLDADEPTYIDTRPPNGIHCMDDNVTDPGIQLPGGLLETSIVSQYMDPKVRRPLPLRKIYKRKVADIVFLDPNILWVHGLVCAAGTFKRDALMATAENPSDALEFTGTVMEAMKVDVSERFINEAGYVGGERADNASLWNASFNTGLQIARRNANVKYEEFGKLHIIAGLRIDTTPHRFNNALFREEHEAHGQQVGVLSVTLGAFKKYLEDIRFSEAHIAKELTHTSLFTFGLAKAKAHNNLRAGIVVPLKNS